MTAEFQIGERVEIDDKTRGWCHGEDGIILAVYPPGSDDPAAYELLVVGRPVQLPGRSLKAKGVTDGT